MRTRRPKRCARASPRAGSAPRVVVELVVGQLDGLLAAPPDADPFASPALRSDDAAFRERFLALERDAVRPALRRHRDFLANEYAPRARSAVGVSANPDGAACYRAALRWSTTLDLDPAAVHARGLAALDEIEAEMREVSASSFGGTPLRELLERLRSDPAFLYRDREHVLALAQAALDRAWVALPRGFGRIPRGARDPRADPRLPGADGGGPLPPGRARRQPARRVSRAALRARAPELDDRRVHRVPRDRAGPPPPDRARERERGAAGDRALPVHERLQRGLGALRGALADELGLYSGAADRLGMLNNRAWRAVRMVVDTGLHVLGWSRERAIEFMLAHTALSREQAAQEIDRYIAWPGQAPSYLVGYEEILALRAEAEQRLGARFDLRAFHDAVLAGGGQTLPVLRARMERWMQSSR